MNGLVHFRACITKAGLVMAVVCALMYMLTQCTMIKEAKITFVTDRIFLFISQRSELSLSFISLELPSKPPPEIASHGGTQVIYVVLRMASTACAILDVIVLPEKIGSPTPIQEGTHNDSNSNLGA
jgi:hypothetical protein